MKPTQVLQCNAPLLGKRLQLERLNSNHLQFLLQSFTHKDFWSSYRYDQPLELAPGDLQAKLDFEYQLLPSQAGKIEWAIRDRHSSSDHFLGLAALAAIDTEKSRAEFLVGIIDPDELKTGIGLEASLLAMGYAFNFLGIRELGSYVYAHNKHAQKGTEALGFRKIRLLKRRFTRHGEDIDMDIVENKMLENEFRQNVRLAKLAKRTLGQDITTNNVSDKPKSSVDSTNSGIQASFELKS